MDDTTPPLLDDEFTREAIAPTKPVDPARRKRTIRRALLTVGGCVLLVVTVLTATGTMGQLWRQARFDWLQRNAPTITHTPLKAQPARRRTLAGGWQLQPQFTLPNPNLRWFIPASNDPNTLYGCSAAQTDKYGYREDGPLAFWYSHDAGQHWSSVPIPHVNGGYCVVSAAPDAPQRLALVSQYYGSVRPQDAACSQLSLFVSDDSGSHWRAVPTLPDSPIQPGRQTTCAVSAWPTTRHLFLSYEYIVMAGADNHVVTHGTSLVRSDNGGQTWRKLDANFPPGSQDYPYLWPLDDGETLLFRVDHYEPAAHGKPYHENTWLWVSRDAGDSWQPLANIDGFFVQTILPANSTRALTPSAAHPLYLISNVSSPSKLLRVQIAQMSDLRHWAPLPPLPIAGASPEHLGITTVLTTTPSGRLLVLGLGPDERIPSGIIPGDPPRIDDQQLAQQWLWEWDPLASRWSLLAPALDAPWPQCSDHCFYGWLAPTQASGETGAYLWVQAFYSESEADPETGSWKTFRIPYTP